MSFAKTAGVIVTYNRKELLVKNIEMLLKQTKQLDNLVIIDNNSEDGTYEFLKENAYLENNWIIYQKLPCNTGGAGGFYHGVKFAYEQGYNLIWLMDDDGRPYREDTYEQIYSVAVGLYQKNKKLFLNCLVTHNGVNLSFPLGMGKNKEHEDGIIASMRESGENLVFGKANPFNGTLITKETISEVGYPAKEFFIIGDEVDYFYRCKEKGALIGTAINSFYFHRPSRRTSKKFLKWWVTIFPDLTGEYYLVRNKTWSLMKKDKIRLTAILLFRVIAIILYEKNKWLRIKQFRRAFMDAKMGKMGEHIENTHGDECHKH